MANTPASSNELLITVGKLVHNATVNEALMFTAFKILSGCPTKTARAIFYTLDSFQPKKSLLNRVVDATGDTEDKKLVALIIAAAEKSNNQRREVAHALLMYESPDLNSTPRIVHPKHANAESKPVTKDWLALLMRHSFEAIQSGLRAFETLSQKHGVPPTPEF